MLRFRKNGTDVFTFGDDGSMTAAVLVPGQATNRMQTGELNFFCNGLPVLETGLNSSGGQELHIRGKHLPQQAPDTGIIPLRLIAPSGTAAASLSYGGSLKHPGKFTGTVKTQAAVQPFKPGNYSVSGGGSLTYKTVTYATSYAGYEAPFSAATLPALAHYLAPTPGYEVKRTADISGFIEPGTTLKNFFFPHSRAPIMGYMAIPDGAGPFPVAVFVHGNYLANSDMDSAGGFRYLCNHLATMGIIALSVSHDFLNRLSGPGTTGDNTYSTLSRIGARTLMVLESLRQLGEWNSTPGHPLYKRVDMSSIMATGHSQGGEAVYYAGYFNMQRSVRYATMTPSEAPASGTITAYSCDVSQVPAWPANRIRQVYFKNHVTLSAYCFYLRSALFVGTVGNTFKHVANDSTATFTRPSYAMENMFIYGSHDNDSNMYEGFCIKSRLTPPESSYALCVEMANHNFFNSNWLNNESGIDTKLLLAPATQQSILKTLAAAFSLKTLHNQAQLHESLANCSSMVSGNQLPPNILYMNYNVPVNSYDLVRTLNKDTSSNQWIFNCGSVYGNVNGNFAVSNSRTDKSALTHIALDNKNFIKVSLAAPATKLQFMLRAGLAAEAFKYIEVVLFYTNQSFSAVENSGTPRFNLELAYGSTAATLLSPVVPLPKAIDVHLKCLLPQTYRFDLNEFINRGVTVFDRISLSGTGVSINCLIHEIRLIA